MLNLACIPVIPSRSPQRIPLRRSTNALPQMPFLRPLRLHLQVWGICRKFADRRGSYSISEPLSRHNTPLSNHRHTSNSSMLHLCALPEHGHRHSVHMNDTFSSTAQPVLRLQEYTAPGTDQFKKCTGVPPGTFPTLRQFHHTYSWFTNSSITPSCSMAVSSRNTTLRNIAATSSDLEALD